ncbi:MAG: group III truncated hemoglobin [Owenweeksia sp.]|nr:group III truncated hemoglobin [Owenweeksia sp.]
MAPKPGLNTRADIEKLVNHFYEKVQADAEIGYIFNKVVKLDWDKHIPVMYDFWESTLFGNATYKGNAMQVHLDLDDRERLLPVHFERWLSLFEKSVDELYAGTIAHLAKTRARSIATVIQLKLQQKNQPIK